jgi:hypothetical protein
MPGAPVQPTDPRPAPTTVELAAFCGVLTSDWYFCEPRDPQAKGCVERRQDLL